MYKLEKFWGENTFMKEEIVAWLVIFPFILVSNTIFWLTDPGIIQKLSNILSLAIWLHI